MRICPCAASKTLRPETTATGDFRRDFKMARFAIRFGCFLATLLIAVLMGSLGVPTANAWGCKGHQTVALIAEKHLTPEARELVLKLLSENPIDPQLKRYCGSAVSDAMGDASTWADDVRGERKNGPWHYIDIPRGAPRGSLEGFCGKEGCVVSAIAEQVAILKDKSANGAKRAEAVRYIIHFVGDLHQPLHSTTNADEGGNCVPVKYFRREPHERGHGFSPNLHSSGIPPSWNAIRKARTLANMRKCWKAPSPVRSKDGRRPVSTWTTGCGRATSTPNRPFTPAWHPRSPSNRMCRCTAVPTTTISASGYYTNTSWPARRIKKKLHPWWSAGWFRLESAWRWS